MPNRPRQRTLLGFDDESEQMLGGGPKKRQPAVASIEPSLANETVYVVDAHALIYQVFHALPEMSGPQGQPVGAIYGFIRDLADLLEKRKPSYLFCAFDHGEITFRNEIYESYKLHREEMPADLRLQIPNIHRMLEALHIPILQMPGFEADDILATLAAQTRQRGGQCFLVTNDKDCRQLIDDQVRMYDIRKNMVIDRQKVFEQWGIWPEQVIDFQAMWGDSTDNVPGIPGVGKKTAAELLQQYGTLDAVLDHVDEIRGEKRRENIRQSVELVQTSRRLVRLDDHVPIDIDWSAGRVGGVDREAVQMLCDEFGFRRLSEQLTGFSTADAPSAWNSNYQLVDTADQLTNLVQQLARQPRIVIDTETTSTNPRSAQLVGLAFAWDAGQACYVPLQAPAGQPRLDTASALEQLRSVLADPAIEKIGQNLKYDMVVLRSHDVAVEGALFDCMVADYLLDPGQRNHGLDELARRYLNHETIKIKELIGTGKKQKQMDQVPVELVMPYAAEDADVPWRLRDVLAARLKTLTLDELFYELEMPLIRILADMEYWGIQVDVALLKQLSKRYGDRLLELEQEIYQLADGARFNIESPSQLANVLFRQLKLPVVKRTKSGPSTDVDVLNQLALVHPLPAKIIEYRQHAKLKSTYLDALPALVHPGTGRVHTSFKQDVAATGRLSSNQPNLQNIPIRTEEGREIRSAFVPGFAGWQLLAADYSQIELRVLAHFSADEALVQAFAEGQDIHAQVASQVHGVPPEEVTGEMRRRAKAINFGVIYGQSPFGLAKALDIDKSEAADFIDAYFAQYPGVERFMTKILAECRENGYVKTTLGRRRAVQGVRDPSRRGDSRQRNLPERIAINTVIQGSAADLIKQAMIRVHGRMQREKLQARMLLQIHDELVFEVPPGELTPLSRLVREEMESVGELNVPLKVDLKAGSNWAECEPLS